MEETCSEVLFNREKHSGYKLSMVNCSRETVSKGENHPGRFAPQRGFHPLKTHPREKSVLEINPQTNDQPRRSDLRYDLNRSLFILPPSERISDTENPSLKLGAKVGTIFLL